jgi:hypothetical protein
LKAKLLAQMYMMVFLIHAPDKNWRAFVQDQAGTHQGCEATSKSLVFSLILGSVDCPELDVDDVVFG